MGLVWWQRAQVSGLVLLMFPQPLILLIGYFLNHSILDKESIVALWHLARHPCNFHVKFAAFTPPDTKRFRLFRSRLCSSYKFQFIYMVSAWGIFSYE